VALGAVRLDPAFAFGLQIEQLLAIGAIAVGAAFGLSPLPRRRAPQQAQSSAPSVSRDPDKPTPEDSLAA
jgi:hypothetical protein